MVWMEAREKKERMRRERRSLQRESAQSFKAMEATHRWLFQAGGYPIASTTGGITLLLAAKIFAVLVPVTHIYNICDNNFSLLYARGKIQL
jgi:hypothetical protein